jgi:hypothetical protein
MFSLFAGLFSWNIVQSGEKTYTLSKSTQLRTMEFFMRRPNFQRPVRTAFFVPNEKIVNRALQLCHAHASAGDRAVIQELCEKRSFWGLTGFAWPPGSGGCTLRHCPFVPALGFHSCVRPPWPWNSIADLCSCGFP